MLNEREIIHYLQTNFPQHIGDDATTIVGPNKQHYVITKDLLVEDIHFRSAYVSPASLAHKALHVNLSDIAAMGANPLFIMCGIAIPLHHAGYASQLLQELTQICHKANLPLIGGDTTGSPDKLFLSITAIGISTAATLKYRNTANIGDIIGVIGNLGIAHLGLLAYENSLSGFEAYQEPFLHPIAKTCEGLWLGQRLEVTSMMDLSDGLLIDLQRLCIASKVAGNIHLEKLQPTPEFVKACTALGLDPINIMLTGGEDYGLLFTSNPDHYSTLAQDFFQTFHQPIKQLGLITPGEGVHLLEQGQHKHLNLKPFSHFSEE